MLHWHCFTQKWKTNSRPDNCLVLSVGFFLIDSLFNYFLCLSKVGWFVKTFGNIRLCFYIQLGISRGRLWLTNLVAFCDGWTWVRLWHGSTPHLYLWIGERRIWRLDCLVNKELSDCRQRVVVNRFMPRWKLMTWCPPGICLGSSALQHLYQWPR